MLYNIIFGKEAGGGGVIDAGSFIRIQLALESKQNPSFVLCPVLHTVQWKRDDTGHTEWI